MRTAGLIGGLICIGLGFNQLGAQRATPEPFRTRVETLSVAIDFPAQRLFASITMEMENWTKQPASRVSLILNRLMEVSSATDASGAPLRFTQDVVRFRDDPMHQVTQVIVDLQSAVAPGQRKLIRLNYAGNLVGYTEVGWLLREGQDRYDLYDSARGRAGFPADRRTRRLSKPCASKSPLHV